MFFNNLRMRSKLLLAFSLITAIFVVVSVLVYSNIQNLRRKAHLMDNAMEMMIAVRTDLQLAMEILESKEETELERLWQIHEELVTEFDSHVDDISGSVEDAALRDPVLQADNVHNTRLQPELQTIYTLKAQEFVLNENLLSAMRSVESDFDQIAEFTHGIEESVKERIESRIADGATAAEILSTENTWADISMEMKTTIALSGMAIEEYGQDMESSSRGEIEAEYAATIEEFDTWIEALLNGAETEEGRIAAVTDPELRELIQQADEYHEEFQQDASHFIENKKARGILDEEIQQADSRADSVGMEMLALLADVEDNAAALFERASATAVQVSIVGVAIGVILAITLGLLISGTITRPLTLITAGADTISKGDIELGDIDHQQFIALNTQKDELGDIGRAFTRLTTYLQEQAGIAERIADGDLRVDVSLASEKDTLGRSLSTMVDSLNDVLGQVTEAVEQVTGGANQVSVASQTLSQGATEQASSLEEITSSIEQVNSQSQQNAGNAKEADGIAGEVNKSAELGSTQMQQLIEAMNGITASSEEITTIVKTIDDIAFQINLLALNANVEAARAGKYGKGFAVVAEEVRSLAGRSGQSVQETSRQVDAANENIRKGSELVTQTSKQLQEIVTGTGKVADLLGEITVASREQSEGIDQITEGLSQIDDVTQSNTASTEQSASSAEELSSQAQELQATISRFKLKGKHVEQKHFRSEQL